MKIKILALPRTGSTYLLNTLRQNFKDYKYYTEPNSMSENTDRFYNFLDYVKKTYDFVYQTKPEDVLSDKVIVKTMHYHKPLDEELWGKDWYTIKLMRRNEFQQTLSLCLGLKSSNFVEPDDKTFRIEEEEFKSGFKFIQEKANKLKEIKADMTVYYEDLTFEPVTDLQNLGFEVKEKNYQKWNKMSDKRKTCENYEEVLKIYETLKNE